MTEDEAKAEQKRQQIADDRALDTLLADSDRIEDAVTKALYERYTMRENLAVTQARCTQLIDESRALRRIMQAVRTYLIIGDPKGAVALLNQELEKLPCT